MLKEPVTAERVERMIEQLDRLFNRGNDGWGGRSTIGDCEPLILPLVLGRIRLKLDTIPLEICRQAAAKWVKGRRGESGPHHYLKRAAMRWMAERGAPDAVDEVGLYGGRLDVFSRKSNWIVECGNTSVRKLTYAIEDNSTPRFTLVPYQKSAYRAESGGEHVRPLRAIHVEWDADLRKDVLEERFAKLRAAVTRTPYFVQR